MEDSKNTCCETNVKAFTHIDAEGNVLMVDVGEKAVTSRIAVAKGSILMEGETFNMVAEGKHKKGDVLKVAQVAGIMGTKRTSELIPMCHLINLTNSRVEFNMYPDENRIEAICTVKCTGQTGVEMEALTGVNIALLTIYDMCKAVDKRMIMTDIHLVMKDGGKSGTFRFDK